MHNYSGPLRTAGSMREPFHTPGTLPRNEVLLEARRPSSRGPGSGPVSVSRLVENGRWLVGYRVGSEKRCLCCCTPRRNQAVVQSPCRSCTENLAACPPPYTHCRGCC